MSEALDLIRGDFLLHVAAYSPPFKELFVVISSHLNWRKTNNDRTNNFNFWPVTLELYCFLFKLRSSHGSFKRINWMACSKGAGATLLKCEQFPEVMWTFQQSSANSTMTMNNAILYLVALCLTLLFSNTLIAQPGCDLQYKRNFFCGFDTTMDQWWTSQMRQCFVNVLQRHYYMIVNFDVLGINGDLPRWRVKERLTCSGLD